MTLKFKLVWLTTPLRWGLAVVAVPTLVAAGGMIWLDTPPGKDFIERQVAALTADGPVRVELTGLGGALPFAPRLAGLRLSDADGVWLEAADLAVELDPFSLLTGTLRLPLVAAGRLEVSRLPAPAAAPAAPPPADAKPFSPDDLPLRRLRLDRLEIGGFKVAESVAGFALAGEVRIAEVSATLKEASAKVDLLRLNDNLLTADLTVDLQRWRATGAVGAELLDLAALAALGGPDAVALGAAGRASLAVALRALDGGGQAATWKLSGDGLKGAGVDLGAAALEGAAAWTEGGASGFDPAKGRLTLENVKLAATGATLSADLSVDLATLRAQGEVAADAPDLARLAALGGEATAGLGAAGGVNLAVKFEAPADGALTATVAAQSHGLKAVGLVIGDAALEAAATYSGPAGGFDPAKGRLTLENIKLTAAGAALSAGLSLDLERLRADGAVNLDVADLARLAAVGGEAAAGLGAAGGFKLGVTLQAPADGGQAATATLRGRGLKAAGVDVGDASLDGAAAYRDGPAQGFDPAKGRVTLDGVRLKAAGASLAADLDIDLARLGGKGSFTVDAPDLGALAALAGQQAAGVDGRATAEVSLRPLNDGGHAATVEARGRALRAAGATIGDAELDLAAAYRPGAGGRFALDDGRVMVESAKLSAAGAALTAQGEMRNGGLAFTWRLNPLALKTLERFAPGLAQAAGTVAAEGDVGGTVNNPAATARIQARGLAVAQTTSAGVKPINADLSLRWADGAGQAEAKAVEGSGKLNLNARATLKNGGKALDAKADGALDLALFNDLLAATGDTAAGRLTFSATAAGDPAAPRLRADAALAGGAYRLHALGTELSNITLKAGFDGKVATLSSLSAETAGRGKLSASGRADIGGAMPKFDFKLTARDALLADSTLATVAADADLTFFGTPAASKITGETTLKKVDIRIPRSLPPDLPALDVVEVGGGRPAAPAFRPGGKAVKAGVENDAAAAVALDVGVTAAPRRVKVKGQGFDGEFGGKVTVRGTAAAPDIAGRFVMQRGSLSVLRREFRFTRGVLQFDGGPEIDPRLDVLAETKAGGDTARIKVQGSPRRPEISFESANGLPSDQVVSQILFGKTTDRLSGGQAVELASALASLSGFEGPASLLGDIQRKLGLDRLDVATGEDGKVTVEAGRNIADGVFVGVKQTADGPKGRVEVELTDSIRVEAGVGASGAPEVGVGFELDY